MKMMLLEMLAAIAEIATSVPDSIALAKAAVAEWLPDNVVSNWPAAGTGGLIGATGHVVAWMAGACAGIVVGVALLAVAAHVIVRREIGKTDLLAGRPHGC